MLSILPGDKVKKLDEAYIHHEGITSWELMERAAQSFCKWLKGNFIISKHQIFIFSGPGNNGGDGVAIARLIAKEAQKVVLIVFEELDSCSLDFKLNFQKLPSSVQVANVNDFDFSLSKGALLLDAIFGVGINRPVSGRYKEAILKINSLDCVKVSIDIPSGIPSDSMLFGDAVKADFTITFQFPKYSLLFPEHAEYTGSLHIADIGIPGAFLEQFDVDKFFIEKNDIPQFHKTFSLFSHKGDFGRILLLGGSIGKVGAIILSAKAALRTGSGLVHVQVAESERVIIQTAAPEVMVAGSDEIKNIEGFDALGIGPGWGTNVDKDFFKSLLTRYHKPVVIDADGLNLLSKNPELLKCLPKGSILTPHLKEFSRLVGESNHHLERLEKAKEFAIKHQVYLVLKGAYSSISTPEGIQYFNFTANQYMATAGSGDVLTGMITSYLGQGYVPLNAALCGVCHHGLAGELASNSKKRGMIASDIIDMIPSTYVNLNIS
jgi:hydroxyethylthiazole kinase-like uncharacterized protein yjeF